MKNMANQVGRWVAEKVSETRRPHTLVTLKDEIRRSLRPIRRLHRVVYLSSFKCMFSLW